MLMRGCRVYVTIAYNLEEKKVRVDGVHETATNRIQLCFA